MTLGTFCRDNSEKLFNPYQKHLHCKRVFQELQVTYYITAIERSDTWCGQD